MCDTQLSTMKSAPQTLEEMREMATELPLSASEIINQFTNNRIINNENTDISKSN